MRLIWYTRGRDWGGRFLADGGLGDPLPSFEQVFDGLPDSGDLWRCGSAGGALRFRDPEGRHDRAGRVIVHEFAVFEPDPGMTSLESARDLVWASVSERYSEIWGASQP